MPTIEAVLVFADGTARRLQVDPTATSCAAAVGDPSTWTTEALIQRDGFYSAVSVAPSEVATFERDGVDPDGRPRFVESSRCSWADHFGPPTQLVETPPADQSPEERKIRQLLAGLPTT